MRSEVYIPAMCSRTRTCAASEIDSRTCSTQDGRQRDVERLNDTEALSDGKRRKGLREFGCTICGTPSDGAYGLWV